MVRKLGSVSLCALVPHEILTEIANLQKQDLSGLMNGLNEKQLAFLKLGMIVSTEIPSLHLQDNEKTTDGESHTTEKNSTTHGDSDHAAEKKVDHEGEGEHEEHDTLNQDELVFLFLCMAIGQLMKQVNIWTGIPYTSLVTIIGLVVGLTIDVESRIGKAIEVYSQIDAHFLLMVFLPPLIFESSFNSDWHIFKVELN